jgi:hypothetical protein
MLTDTLPGQDPQLPAGCSEHMISQAADGRASYRVPAGENPYAGAALATVLNDVARRIPIDDVVPVRIVAQRKAIDWMREELGEFTTLQCTESYGSWMRGGPVSVKRVWSAFYCPTPNAVTPELVSVIDLPSPIEAVSALILAVKAKARPPVSLGRLDGNAMEAAHGAVSGDEEERRAQWDKDNVGDRFE